MKPALAMACMWSIVAGCTATAPEPDLELCTDPRPQMCTREYNPVCATLADGSTKTYATGCTACSDPAVTGWVMGACD